jgi:hypothetical protein
MEPMRIVRGGIAIIDTMFGSFRSATGRRTNPTVHLTGVGGADRRVASTEQVMPSLEK